MKLIILKLKQILKVHNKIYSINKIKIYLILILVLELIH